MTYWDRGEGERRCSRVVCTLVSMLFAVSLSHIFCMPCTWLPGRPLHAHALALFFFCRKVNFKLRPAEAEPLPVGIGTAARSKAVTDNMLAEITSIFSLEHTNGCNPGRENMDRLKMRERTKISASMMGRLCAHRLASNAAFR